jgi:dihydroorotate dehydrogenase
LQELLSALQQANQRCASELQTQSRPILVKVAPDLSWPQLDEILAVAEETRSAGIIATNTTVEREGLRTQRLDAREAGGLSGAPLARRANEMIAYISRQTQGKLPLIGVGGVFSAEDVLIKLRAGASLVQLYTALIYEGPTIAKQINRALIQKMEQAHVTNLIDLVHVTGQ